MKKNVAEKTKEENHKTVGKAIPNLFEKLNSPVTVILGIVTLMILVSMLSTHFVPYVVSSKEKMEYFPEDYLLIYNIDENPTYIMKTTETAIVKPKTIWFNNEISFQLPNDCFDVQAMPSNKYSFNFDEATNKVTFKFLQKRSEVETIQVSYSYEQRKNPHIVLCDYQFTAKNDTIEEVLVLKNTENTKVAPFKGIRRVNNDDRAWFIEKVNMTPYKIFVQNEEIEFDYTYTNEDSTDILLYSWDMSFDEYELKTVRIVTLTNLEYNWYESTISLKQRQPSYNPEFPFPPGTYEWTSFISTFENYPYVNEADYIEGYSIRVYNFPLDKTTLEHNIEVFSERNATLGY